MLQPLQLQISPSISTVHPAAILAFAARVLEILPRTHQGDLEIHGCRICGHALVVVFQLCVRRRPSAPHTCRVPLGNLASHPFHALKRTILRLAVDQVKHSNWQVGFCYRTNCCFHSVQLPSESHGRFSMST